MSKVKPKPMMHAGKPGANPQRNHALQVTKRFKGANEAESWESRLWLCHHARRGLPRPQNLLQKRNAGEKTACLRVAQKIWGLGKEHRGKALKRSKGSAKVNHTRVKSAGTMGPRPELSKVWQGLGGSAYKILKGISVKETEPDNKTSRAPAQSLHGKCAGRSWSEPRSILSSETAPP